MKKVLIFALDDISASLLADTVAAAGFIAACPRADEGAEEALGRLQPDVVLVDAELPVLPKLMRGLGHVATVCILVSGSLSSYELSARARDHGVTHFNHSGGPAGLARAVADAITLARLPVPRRSVAAAAAASMQRARALTEQAGDVLATSNELRIANRIALAACRMNRQLLRDTVVACTRDLQRTGMALDLVVELVTAAVEGSALDHPASRAEVQAEAEAAAEWAVEAWRAA